MMLTKDDSCWAWGDDRQGQLGFTPDGIPTDPLFVDHPVQLKEWGAPNFRTNTSVYDAKFFDSTQTPVRF
jgi:hypothetical protein